MRDLSLHLLDIAQNSVRAGAEKISIVVEADTGNDQLMVTVKDNGSGMPPDLLRQATDPFISTRETRSVGLGLPLFKELCEQTGGQFELASKAGEGTSLKASLGLSSIDRLPIGNLGDTVVALVMTDPSTDFEIYLKAGDRQADLKTADMRQILKEIPLIKPDVLDWINRCIQTMQQEIFGGILNEIDG